jgi:hypothetical protein
MAATEEPVRTVGAAVAEFLARPDLCFSPGFRTRRR